MENVRNSPCLPIDERRIQCLAEKPIKPFLKWPGGKRWFIAKHADILPSSYNRYIEPFLGSGSVYFWLKPENAILGDINSDLITAYQGIKENWFVLTELLKEHQSLHSESHYYKIRDLQPTSPIEAAARFIYLNRTCFNGIYRVNLQGNFNVPKGTKDSVLLPDDDFQAISKLLQTAELRSSDFEALIDEAQENDLLFVDPPYTVRHNVNGFIKYNEILFSWDDQLRLASALTRAWCRGAIIVATNANHESLRTLYSTRNFRLATVSRFSSISANSKSRKQFEELIIVGN